MDQRELETRLKALQKAVGDKDSADNVISILETLKKEVSPTEELLRVCSCLVAHSRCDYADVLLSSCRMANARRLQKLA